MRNDFDLAGIPGFTGTPTDGEALNTPGDPNEAYEPPVVVDTCESAITSIHDIQGNGAASQRDGESVLTQGVVVGRFQSGTRDTVYIQTPVVDDDANTSEGIYVFADAAAFAVGQTVRVRGTVDEFNGLTELTAVTNIFRCGEGTTTIEPTELSLPIETAGDLEKYEGMLVTFPQDLVIAEYFNFAQFGEVSLTADRQDTPTAVVEPGPPAIELAADQALAPHPAGRRAQCARTRARRGTRTARRSPCSTRSAAVTCSAASPASWTSSSTSTASSRQPGRRTPRSTSGPSVPDVGGSLTVSSFNVLNYFSTLDSRGANTEEELVRQEDKIVAALAEIDADVFGLLEIENNEAGRPSGSWPPSTRRSVRAPTTTSAPARSAPTSSRSALIYKPGTVTPVGDTRSWTRPSTRASTPRATGRRVAQTFRENGTDEVVTVAVNHLKSKGSACAGDPDTGDGSGNCDVTRTQAAAGAGRLDGLRPDGLGLAEEPHHRRPELLRPRGPDRHVRRPAATPTW